jgi:predicted ATPase/DNA-binding SARP family transcriptional activator/Tfp pilus assembly protein PilF
LPILSLSLLGPFAAGLDHQPIPGFRTRATQALLVYLACRPDQPHRREQLMTLLWPGLPQPSAQANLRQTLYQLRQALQELPARHHDSPEPLLQTDWQTVRINSEAGLEVDVLSFEALIGQGQAAWSAAVDLYRGDFLADFYLPDSPAFEEWAQARREALRRQALGALHHLAGRALASGDHDQAAAYARRQLELDNLDEEAHRQLMLALAAAGRRSAALAHYEHCRRLLRDQLGVEPSPQTRVLYERLARGEIPEAAAAPAGEAAPPAVMTRPRHNLPLHLSSFIGRETELAELRRLLAGARLVTLTGAGGCGKSRLALQAAAGLVDDFADGVWLVELAPLADPALVPQAVAEALDLQTTNDRPARDHLLAYLRPRQMLLILDNCEHLIEDAAGLAETLLGYCPHLRILATSREALDVPGETAWLVPSLALPESGEPPVLADLAQVEAIRLFVERAAAVLSTFSLTEGNAAAVVHLCQRLDGIPLAIELAAARVKLLRVEQIAARLDDRFGLLTGGSRTALPRHRTLAALIDWSYELLSPAEQRLLRRLSVFPGSFTYDAVEAVCADGEGGNTLELLAQLVNKSLVGAGREPGQEARYHLLETIRQYAWEKLASGGEALAARDAHLAHFLELAETAASLLLTGAQLLWLDRLDAEHDNLLAALAWSLRYDNADPASGLRLATALAEYWVIRSRPVEARYWLDLARARSDGADPAVRARLLIATGRFWADQAQPNPAPLLHEALFVCRRLDDKAGAGWALCWLGWSYHNFRDPQRAAATFWTECLALALEIGDKPLQAWATGSLGLQAVFRGDFVEAEQYGAACLAAAREAGDRQATTGALFGLGICARRQRDYDRAQRYYQEALVLARELKSRTWEMRILNSLGERARCQRNYEQAALFYGESLALAREMDYHSATTLHNLGLVAIAQGDWTLAREYLHESLAIAPEVATDGVHLWNLWALARLAFYEGRLRRAARLFAAWEAQSEPYEEVLDPADQEDIDRELAQLRAALGEEAFAAAQAEGRAMTLEQAVAYALERGS